MSRVIPRSIRFTVLERDSFTCRYCGAKAPDVKLHVDHVIPDSHGGPTHPDNLVTACAPCNEGKASRLLSNEGVRDAAALGYEREEYLKETLRQASDRVPAYPVNAPQIVVEQIQSEGQALTVSIRGASLTSAYVAGAVGKSESYICRLANGERRIPERLVGPLCAATGTNLLRQYIDYQRIDEPVCDIDRLAQLLRAA